MFTGIITNTTAIIGSKRDGKGQTITFVRPEEWDDLELGESVATNGVCLTITALRAKEYDCHLMAETLAKTSFGQVIPATVNLERALRANDRMSGHFVQGHIDGVGQISHIETVEGANISITFDPKFEPLVVYKGSVTVNGVSLTVSKIVKNTLTVSLIPYTLEHTTLGTLVTGDPVNLEFDIIGKYIHKSIKGVPDYATGRTS